MSIFLWTKDICMTQRHIPYQNRFLLVQIIIFRFMIVTHGYDYKVLCSILGRKFGQEALKDFL